MTALATKSELQSAAYLRGGEDYLAGAAQFDFPREFNDAQREEWLDGWLDAQSENWK